MDAGILVKMEAAIGIMQSYIAKDYVLSCAMSGGKDSSCVMVLMLEAIRRSARHHRGSHYILSANTTIETRPSQIIFMLYSKKSSSTPRVPAYRWKSTSRNHRSHRNSLYRR
jgi:predicted phosphoadenosine phosphosulfate sulfurtransferase